MNRARVSASNPTHASGADDQQAATEHDAGHPHAERPPRVRQRRQAQSRQAWMSVSRMPRAPRSNSSSISRWAPARGTIARTADQPSRCSGATVGLSMPGVSCDRRGDLLGRDVVVHHHVAARDQDALDPAPEDLEAVGHRAGAGDQHRLGVEDGLAERLQPGLAQRAAGLDDVGDHVGDAELDAGLDRAVEPGHGGVDAALLQERADHPDVRRGDPQPGELVEVGVGALRAGEPEPAAAEPEAHHLVGLRARVHEQVTAGDADVEGALADVERDVARAQVEELDAVLGVGQRQLLGVVALPVAGLAQDLGGRQGRASPCWGPRCGAVPSVEASSEVCVDVVELDAGGQHQDLGVVEQLADLLGGPVRPSCSAAIQDSAASSTSFLPMAWTPASSCAHGAGSLGAGPGLLAQLGPELVERLHGRQAYGVVRALTTPGSGR